MGHKQIEQELSYRKQIARHLCTQYIDGIYANPVDLEAWLRVIGNGTIGLIIHDLLLVVI